MPKQHRLMTLLVGRTKQHENRLCLPTTFQPSHKVSDWWRLIYILIFSHFILCSKIFYMSLTIFKKHFHDSIFICCVISVQFSRSVVSDSLQPHRLQHSRFPWPSQTSRAYSNSCPLSWWCHPTISSSGAPFSTCPQSFPALGAFLVSQLFSSSGQSTGASASASVLPMNIQNWFHLEWTGWISWQSRGLSRVFSNTTVQKHQFFSAQPSLWPNSNILTRILEKPYLWLYGPLSPKWCLCFLICCLVWS